MNRLDELSERLRSALGDRLQTPGYCSAMK